MARQKLLDQTDARLLLLLERDPRATVLALAEKLGLSRNTVQARLAKLGELTGVGPLGAGVEPAAFGYPLTAFVFMTVTQQKLAAVGRALAQVPEILEVSGLSGSPDLFARVVAADADDLYRIAGLILETDGITRVDTALLMRQLVDFRLEPLVKRLAEGRPRSGRQ
jgi:DNA-binding Lrp family transcriptional regulator